MWHPFYLQRGTVGLKTKQFERRIFAASGARSLHLHRRAITVPAAAAAAPSTLPAADAKWSGRAQHIKCSTTMTAQEKQPLSPRQQNSCHCQRLLTNDSRRASSISPAQCCLETCRQRQCGSALHGLREPDKRLCDGSRDWRHDAQTLDDSTATSEVTNKLIQHIGLAAVFEVIDVYMFGALTTVDWDSESATQRNENFKHDSWSRRPEFWRYI